MSDPRTVATGIEIRPVLPAGNEERFVGYGVMAQPFASGHLLALRRFPATSVGPAYTSIWHRDPELNWTFRITGKPMECCNRYFGSIVDETMRVAIDLQWVSPNQLTISTADGQIQWSVALAPSPTTRVLSRTAGLIPDVLWRQPFMPAMTGAMAGSMLRVGRMKMHGAVPNGQEFRMNPPQVWSVSGTQATVNGVDLGPAGPLRLQDNLADFWLPQRGLFYAGSVLFERYTEERHRLVSNRSGTPGV